MGFKTFAKLFGVAVGTIFVLLDIIFTWVPSGGLTIMMAASTLGGFTFCVVILPVVVYLADFLHVLFNAAKEKVS